MAGSLAVGTTMVGVTIIGRAVGAAGTQAESNTLISIKTGISKLRVFILFS